MCKLTQAERQTLYKVQFVPSQEFQKTAKGKKAASHKGV